MKDLNIKILLLAIFCFNYINSQCIPGSNCPLNQGYCKADVCICINNFWTLNTQEQSNPFIYCNYQKYSRFYLLLMEFFLPTSGHFIAGKYYYGFIKLFLLLTPILSCIIGFCFYYNEEGNKTTKSTKIDYTRENGEPAQYHDQNDNNLHIANREEKKVDLSVYLPTIITFVSLSLFLVMHIIDIICYAFAIYSDGYGVPLV